VPTSPRPCDPRNRRLVYSPPTFFLEDWFGARGTSVAQHPNRRRAALVTAARTPANDRRRFNRARCAALPPPAPACRFQHVLVVEPMARAAAVRISCAPASLNRLRPDRPASATAPTGPVPRLRADLLPGSGLLAVEAFGVGNRPPPAPTSAMYRRRAPPPRARRPHGPVTTAKKHRLKNRHAPQPTASRAAGVSLSRRARHFYSPSQASTRTSKASSSGYWIACGRARAADTMLTP